MIDLSTITLGHGAHETRDDGVCAMEAVAWLAGEPHSDAPSCTCPVIAAAVRRLNDRMPDDATRTELLRPLLPRLLGTASTREVRIARGYVAADMAVRVFAPLALEARGRLDLARVLRGARPIVDRETAEEGRQAARSAADAAAAAADAAYAAAAYAAYAAAADAAAAAAEAAASAADAAADAAYAAAAAYARRRVYEEGVRMIVRMLEVGANTGGAPNG